MRGRGSKMLLDDAVFNDADYQNGLELGQKLSRLVDEGGAFDFKAAWQCTADCGLFNTLIPANRLDSKRAVSILEGLGQSCDHLGFPLAIGAHCFGVGAPVRKYASTSNARLLADLRSGRCIAGLAATETEAGSDLMSLTTRYTETNGGYVVSGEKRYIANALDCDFFLVLATKDPRLNYRGVSAFVVPSDLPGVRITRMKAPPGLEGCSIGVLTLDTVTVPLNAQVGRGGEGLKIFETSMLWERGLITAATLGVLRRQLLNTISFCKSRKQFRRPIAHNQHVSGRVVDAFVSYVTARTLVRDTAARLEDDTLPLALAGVTKLYVSERMLSASIDLMKNRGSQGLFDDGAGLSHVSSALSGVVYSGTSDIQKVIIAKELGLFDQ